MRPPQGVLPGGLVTIPAFVVVTCRTPCPVAHAVQL